SFVDRVPAPGAKVLVQHRAHGDAAAATLKVGELGSAEVRYEAPVEAIAPGQSAAFYDADSPHELIGGGIVAATVAAGAVA
ncbi:MAG: tRNA 2-thiouridine(34) synthase MnmA, partial [Actinomycetota bacterium]|nr:tRNA 2-thiouridine(34) synthase MnmA [Actinomycetota bacterium]